MPRCKRTIKNLAPSQSTGHSWTLHDQTPLTLRGAFSGTQARLPVPFSVNSPSKVHDGPWTVRNRRHHTRKWSLDVCLMPSHAPLFRGPVKTDTAMVWKSTHHSSGSSSSDFHVVIVNFLCLGMKRAYVCRSLSPSIVLRDYISPSHGTMMHPTRS